MFTPEKMEITHYEVKSGTDFANYIQFINSLEVIIFKLSHKYNTMIYL